MATCGITIRKSTYKIIPYKQKHIRYGIIHMFDKNILTSSTTLMLKLVSAVNRIKLAQITKLTQVIRLIQIHIIRAIRCYIMRNMETTYMLPSL